MNTIHLFPNGQVEKGTGRPGYRWVPAYSQLVSETTVSMPLTRRDWQAMGKRDGFRCKFHVTQLAAKGALLADRARHLSELNRKLCGAIFGPVPRKRIFGT